MIKIAIIKLIELEEKNIEIKDIKGLCQPIIKGLATKILTLHSFLELVNEEPEFRSIDLEECICIVIED